MTDINSVIKRVCGSARLTDITDMYDLVEWLDTRDRSYKTFTFSMCIHDAMMLGNALLDEGLSSWYEKHNDWYGELTIIPPFLDETIPFGWD